ncbi:REP-associated tyrosine transposase [Wenxinia marina]|uniref:Transposase n=1 Tax=Wenxinia marina DSM 24838 TaxID=1123501 RepID=A0A0D0PIV0_9RHOB|nr:transposase [Wenxinia marina]KIQ71306.1 Transposase [Wenxinia marina DSM 24838]GGL73769.1 transposase [Wenxinia marina]
MTAYLRRRGPGGTYFFTVKLAEAGSGVLIDHVDLLRRAYAHMAALKPLTCHAMVVLPDHLYALWTLPEEDADYSNRWGALKARFSRDFRVRLGLPPLPRSPSRRRKKDAGIWQRRFWEHAIRDDAEFEAHRRYCWMNPVKHGLVADPADWAFSSIHREIRAGTLPADFVRSPEKGEVGEAA